MKLWTTEIQAIDPKDGVLKIWSGQVIEAVNLRDAELYCKNNGLGFCKITGVLVAEIPLSEIRDIIDYTKIQMN